MSRTRRLKWHPPSPPSSTILHLPRRTHWRESDSHLNKYGTLENLLDQEQAFYPIVPIVLLNIGYHETRERVDDFEYTEMMDSRRCSRDFEDEKCNFMRNKREVALKKMEKNRKLYEGKNVSVMLEEEIKDLKEKLEELQRSSCIKNFEFHKCINFYKQEAEECVKEIQEIAEASLMISKNCRTKECFVSDRKSWFVDVENLRRKMEVLSKGMLERMEEEYRLMLSTTITATASASSSVASSASTSMCIEFPDSSSSSSSIKQQ
uniref:Uncharacterized protein n=1 Tax=Nelumbo nucifera TaxID=4432 RepID=A0A822YC00_NELNU|nr:TPA_asm: hypothetical protein HUJ06_030003 [Nelumbo nucifera]